MLHGLKQQLIGGTSTKGQLPCYSRACPLRQTFPWHRASHEQWASTGTVPENHCHHRPQSCVFFPESQADTAPKKSEKSDLPQRAKDQHTSPTWAPLFVPNLCLLEALETLDLGPSLGLNLDSTGPEWTGSQTGRQLLNHLARARCWGILCVLELLLLGFSEP